MAEQLVEGTRRWSTDSVRPQHALDYWVATVCDHLLEMQINSPARQSFQGRLTVSRLGNCDLSMIEAESQQILRTTEMIGKSRFSDYRLLYFRSGGGLVSQRDRCADVAQGDCVLLDASEIYSLHFPEPTACTVLTLPRAWLHTWVTTPEMMVARKLDMMSGWGATLSAAMRCISPETVDQICLPGCVVTEQIAALLALAGDRYSHSLEAPRDPLLERLRNVLHERCHEQDLGPQSVATDNRISKRYLHMVFARAGSTFSEELMAVRLQLAHRLLSDRRFHDLPIGEISARCGFTEPSHFARRFKLRFRVSPTEFRRQTGPA